MKSSGESMVLSGLFAATLVLVAAAALLPAVGPTPFDERVVTSLWGLGALGVLVLLLVWAVSGFSGYEHRIGLRIVGRPYRSSLTWRPIAIAFALAAVGIGVLALGIRSAPVAVVVAVASLAGTAMIIARRFAVAATLAIMGIAISVAALIVVQSVATGFQHEFERRVLGVYAHINVTRAFGISEYRRFEQYLRTVDGVSGASPFVYYAMALAPVGRDSEHIRRASVLVKGIEPTTAAEVIDLEDHLRQGSDTPVSISALTTDIELQPRPDRDDAKLPPVIAATPDPRGEDWYPEAMRRWRALPESKKHAERSPFADDDDWPEPIAAEEVPNDDALPTMFVGVTLARELDLKAGDVVMLVDPGAGFDHSQAAAPQFRRYRIAGVFRAGFLEYDSRLVYVHIRELQSFKYQARDVVSGIDLRLHEPYDAPRVEALLRSTIGDDEYSILEWQKLNANLFQSIRTQKSILTVIMSLIGAVAGFNVLAALWTIVMRRTAEIAITMSMGATVSGVVRVFQFAGMTLGATGCVVGVAFGLLLCWIVQLYGYTLDIEVYYIERLPVELSLEQIAYVLAFTMGISFIATLLPSLLAAGLRPLEGLRYE